MTLTKRHTYTDKDYDVLGITSCAVDGHQAYIEPTEQGVYIKMEDAPAVALNILGHDTPTDDREDGSNYLSTAERDRALENTAAILRNVILFDLRQKRLVSAEQRRKAAAASLSSKLHSVVGLPITSPIKDLTGDDIGKLREALGRYDAELAN